MKKKIMSVLLSLQSKGELSIRGDADHKVVVWVYTDGAEAAILRLCDDNGLSYLGDFWDYDSTNDCEVMWMEICF